MFKPPAWIAYRIATVWPITQNTFCVIVLAALVGIVYLPYLSNPLIFDDLNLFNGATIVDYALGFHLEPRWLPIATLAHNFFLTDGSIVAVRLGNVFLHLANATAVFVLLRELLAAMPRPLPVPGDRLAQARLVAFWGAALFAVHPITVYAVGYLAQRTIIMSTLFMLLMWITYLRWLVTARQTLWAWSAIWYGLSVFSKEHSVMAPVATLLMCALLSGPVEIKEKLTRHLMPYAAYCVIAIVAIYMASSPLGRAFEPVTAGLSEAVTGSGVSWAQSMLTQAYLYWNYLLLWLAPLVNDMSIDMRAPVAASVLTVTQAVAVIAFLAYPVAALIWVMRRGRFALVGWLLAVPWFLFLTELSTVRVLEPFVLYRAYLWFPLVGALAPLVALRWNSAVAMSVGASMIVLMIGLSWNRLDSMSSSLRLWDDAAKLLVRGDEPGAARIYYNRSLALLAEGRNVQALSDMDRVIALHPRLEMAYIERAKIHYQMGNWDIALRDLDHVIGSDPENVNAYFLRALTRKRLGQAAGARQDLSRACELKHVIACMGVK